MEMLDWLIDVLGRSTLASDTLENELFVLVRVKKQLGLYVL